ncbi:hypothetical protein VTH82DRAFT_8716 [Thermothelomyces myriococcoides]
MDALLQTLGAQTVNFAIRSGLALTSRYAVQQCSRLLKSVNDKAVRVELRTLQKVLDDRIKILSPALDLIEFKSSRGNAFLEAAVPLAKSLHREIIRLGKRLDSAATAEEECYDSHGNRRGSRGADVRHAELLAIIRDIKELLARIDRDIPLLQFAITVSGEKMSSSMTPGISPSRMMQASALLSFADAQFVSNPSQPMQVGSCFTLTLYMLFLGHSQVGPSPGSEHRSPPTAPDNKDQSAKEAPYGLGEEIIEDLNDGRLHDGDESRFRPYEDIRMAGLRESIPIHQISKIFYTDTGRILNIGNSDEKGNNPVLLLKRDINAKCPIRMRQEWFEEPEPEKETESPPSTADDSSESDEQEDINRQLWEESEHSPKSWASQDGARSTYLPAHLDPEWLALEVYTEEDDRDDEEDEEEEEEEDTRSKSGARQRTLSGIAQTSGDGHSQDSKVLAQLEHFSIGAGSPAQDLGSQPAVCIQKPGVVDAAASYVARSPFGSIISSLSLLEMLIRLTSLQEFQQVSHLAIPDHILMFFLEETSTTGLHGEAQWRARSDAKRRMGFDPYTDSFPAQNGE